jgi:nitrogen PTS system EIIA component
MTKKMLTFIEAAKYLKVTEKVIHEMVKDNVFKTAKVGKSLKIDKDSIDEWMENLSENDGEQLAMQRTICRFEEYFRIDNIFLDFHADNKYEAIRITAEKAKELKIVRDAKWLYEVVVAREELVSTAVGNGVALLHPRHLHPTKIKTPSILFGRSDEGVEFDAPDNKPVCLFFMLLLHNDKQHLFSLSYISKLLMNDSIIDLLNKSNSPDEIHQALTSL